MVLAGGSAGSAGRGEHFVSDIFHEVDEEVRREQLKKLWERYGNLLIAGCVAIVLAAAGWRTYEFYQAKQAAEASARFEGAVALVNEGKKEGAEGALEKVPAAGPPTSRRPAGCREAGKPGGRYRKAAAALFEQ